MNLLEAKEILKNKGYIVHRLNECGGSSGGGCGGSSSYSSGCGSELAMIITIPWHKNRAT